MDVLRCSACPSWVAPPASSACGAAATAVTFTGVAPPAPVVLTNHGDCVSGATHAGVKGKDLAAIAKDVTLVGPYKG